MYVCVYGRTSLAHAFLCHAITQTKTNKHTHNTQLQVLEKTFYMDNPDEVVPDKFVGTTIDWAAGKDCTGKEWSGFIWVCELRDLGFRNRGGWLAGWLKGVGCWCHSQPPTSWLAVTSQRAYSKLNAGSHTLPYSLTLLLTDITLLTPCPPSFFRTVEQVKQKKKGKKGAPAVVVTQTKPCDSFFNFFK